MANPKWWNEEHESTWTRVKAAMKRDWEQTKADVSDKGRDLDQDVGDTVKQAAGKQPIPPMGVKSYDDDDLDRDEDAYRFGAGARAQYGTAYRTWDDRVEAKMRDDWEGMHTGRTWDSVKAKVRRAWDRVTK
jgi:hypothetical protein